MSGSAFETFKININELNLPVTTTSIIIPTVQLNNITYNSVAVKVTADINDDKKCNLYRSTDNINFEYISSVDCKNGETYIDKNIDEATTYFYKATVSGSESYSKIALANTPKNTTTTTNSNNNNLDQEEKEIENAKTGVSFPGVSTSLLLISCITIIIYLKNKNPFQKI